MPLSLRTVVVVAAVAVAGYLLYRIPTLDLSPSEGGSPAKEQTEKKPTELGADIPTGKPTWSVEESVRASLSWDVPTTGYAKQGGLCVVHSSSSRRTQQRRRPPWTASKPTPKPAKTAPSTVTETEEETKTPTATPEPTEQRPRSRLHRLPRSRLRRLHRRRPLRRSQPRRRLRLRRYPRHRWKPVMQVPKPASEPAPRATPNPTLSRRSRPPRSRLHPRVK